MAGTACDGLKSLASPLQLDCRPTGKTRRRPDQRTLSADRLLALRRLLKLVATLACVAAAAACVANTGVTPSFTTPPPNEGSCGHVSQNGSCFYREAPSRRAQRLIIFVHGVLGGVATSWGTEANNTSWPAAVALDARFATFDIFLMGYLTPLLDRASNIHETALDQLSMLENRHVFERYNEIHFIAHSMGGLIVKNMLVALRARSELDKLRRVRSVTFLGTPAQGASAATFAAMFSSNPQFRGMEPAHLNEAIQMLEDDWRRLLQARGRGFARFPRVRCAYETLSMVGSEPVVPRQMASSDCDGDFQPMTLNHSQMAKFIRTDANPYLWTMGGIATIAKGLDEQRQADAALQKGHQFYALGNNEAARTLLMEAKILYHRVDGVLGEANALLGLAHVDRILGRNDNARDEFTQARLIYSALQDREGEADVVLGIASLDRMLGRAEQARAGFIEALRTYKTLDHRAGEARALVGLGDLNVDRDEFSEARAKYDDARSLFRGLGRAHSFEERDVVFSIGAVELLRGRLRDAQAAYAEAGKMSLEAGSGRGVAHAFFGLARVDYASGDPDAARSKFQKAIEIYKAERDRFWEANVLMAVAELNRMERRFEDAKEGYSQSLRLYRALESRLGEANVLISLGRLSLAIGKDLEEARRYFYQAAALYTGIGMLQRGEAAEAEARAIPAK